ncbi:MAG: PEGA domain-containing protein [Ignavibacteriales bacterium]|nr:PEGA domain-containing protein [Ignavibacteriales bacterium]
MRRIISLFASVLVILLPIIFFNSCATIFKGSHEDVEFASEPSGAKVYINGDYMGKTPLELPLFSDLNYEIELKKSGYKTKRTFITSKVGAGWVILDFVGGLIPILIDAATGDWYGLSQDNVNAILEKQQYNNHPF